LVKNQQEKKKSQNLSSSKRTSKTLSSVSFTYCLRTKKQVFGSLLF
jgi:hypothetical protein